MCHRNWTEEPIGGDGRARYPLDDAGVGPVEAIAHRRPSRSRRTKGLLRSPRG